LSASRQSACKLSGSHRPTRPELGQPSERDPELSRYGLVDEHISGSGDLPCRPCLQPLRGRLEWIPEPTPIGEAGFLVVALSRANPKWSAPDINALCPSHCLAEDRRCRRGGGGEPSHPRAATTAPPSAGWSRPQSRLLNPYRGAFIH